MRVGARRITLIEDMVYNYSSPVFKNSGGEHHESLLQSIYHYRNYRFTEVANAQLNALISAMAHLDTNGVLLNYMLTIEGPAYSCHCYWDWIEPFVNSRISWGKLSTDMMHKFKTIRENIYKIKQKR